MFIVLKNIKNFQLWQRYNIYNQNDFLLFPPCIGEFVVPENHPVRTVNAILDNIDISDIESVANKYTFVWKGSVEKNKSKLLVKLDAILKEAEAVLEEENISDFHNEITKEDLQQRTDRILEKMNETELSDKKLRK